MSLKIQTGSSVTVKFPYGDFKQVSDTFRGTQTVQYLYSIEVNGAKDYLYADEDLHALLQEAGLKKGSRFTLSKHKNGKQVTWLVEANGHASSPAPLIPPPAALQPSDQADQKGPEAATPASSESEALARGLFGLMARCLRESQEAWQWLGENFTADNVQATANTLFIACKDRDIVLPPVPYPDRDQMEALARIGDAILPEQNARLQKKVSEGITWTEAQAIIDYYEQNHKQASKAA